MKILITGGDGQLAADLLLSLSSHDTVAIGRDGLDITNHEAIEDVLTRETPDVVVNTAAFHRVDLCEDEPEQSFLVNSAGPRRLARACDRLGATFVHFSTDYVFDGRKMSPYVETDTVNPLSVYGSSKAAGEMVIRCTGERHLIVRTTGVFGLAGARSRHGNFVETMLRLAAKGDPVFVVADQTLTPTYGHDLAETVRALIETEVRGTVHVTGGGECSWHEFATEIFRLAGSPTLISPTLQDERPAPARRPAYSVLAHHRLKGLGIREPRHWKEALQEYISVRAAKLGGNEFPPFWGSPES
jgi:dTDP-4-dehydrorhamnose reductase